MPSNPRTVSTAEWPAFPEPSAELLDTIGVAQVLGYHRRPRVTPEKATRLIRYFVKNSGLKPFGRIGRRMFFRRADLLAWLASSMNRNASDPDYGAGRPEAKEASSETPSQHGQ